jgi:hypothetical protein
MLDGVTIDEDVEEEAVTRVLRVGQGSEIGNDENGIAEPLGQGGLHEEKFGVDCRRALCWS